MNTSTAPRPQLTLEQLHNATWYDVPQGTKPSACKGCNAPMYWITAPSGKKVPVDCDVDGALAPTHREPGVGISHFKTCSTPKTFSGRNA